MSALPGSARITVGSPVSWAWVLGGLNALAIAALLPLAILGRNGGFTVEPLVIGLPTAAVGVIVARRQPGNALGWLLLAIAACQLLSTDGGLYSVFDYRFHGGALPLGPVAIGLYELWTPGLMLLGLVILLFPDGRLPSPRWRWVLRAYLALYVALIAAFFIATAQTMVGHQIRVDATGGLPGIDRATGWFGAVQGAVLPAMLVLTLCFAGRQVLSWRRAGGERRQQLKWLMTGAVTNVACLVLVGQSNSAGIWKVVAGLAWLGFGALPVGIGVAILKYRLYDIDRIISRTLAYAIVTGTLAGLYVGLVTLASLVLGSTSALAVAISTLAAAALFSPLRRRVQRVVDRRFNRARYDAERTVSAFTARLQDALDLDDVRAELLNCVHKALEPAHASVWLAGGGT